MKTICYNSKLAKLILFGCYTTIMFFGFILTKLKELSKTAIRHERIHQKQFFECMEIAAIPSALLSFYGSAWWLLLIPLFYSYTALSVYAGSNFTANVSYCANFNSSIASTGLFNYKYSYTAGQVIVSESSGEQNYTTLLIHIIS